MKKLSKFIKRKLIYNRCLCLLLVGLLTLTVGCSGETETTYKDMIEKPTDIPQLLESSYMSYPEKVTSLAEIDKSSLPTCKDAVPSQNSGYKVTNGETIKIEYEDLNNWDYVYIPVENYYSDYGNVKIIANGSGAERIAIQVIYYEMYENNYKPVTVYLGDIVDGQQYFISTFSQYKALNENYIQVEDSDLAEMRIIGLCLFIDSNPSQMRVKDTIGTLEITSIKFLKDDDKELEDRYVAPSVALDFMDAGYSGTKDPETGAMTINREAGTAYWNKAFLAVTNYSSDYSAFNLKFDTTGVQTIYIALQFSVEGHNWLDSVEIYQAKVEDGSHEVYIDFSGTQPIDIDSGYDYAAGYYVKNYRINSIQIYLDTYVQDYVPDFDASCTITELKFERIVNEGTTISKGWSAGSSSIILGEDIIAGGTGTISFECYYTWYCLTMPILNYETADKLTIKFEAKDGIDHIGIALVVGGIEDVLRGSYTLLNGNESVIEEKTGRLEGLIEIIEYSKITKIYTITFDFTNLSKLQNYDNKSINELAITALRFYFTVPESVSFEGTKDVRFISIEFGKNE